MKKANVTSSSAPEQPLSFATIAFVFALTIPVTVLLGPIALSATRLTLLLAFIPCFFVLLSGRKGSLIATDLFFFAFACWFSVAMLYHHGPVKIERIGQNMLDSFGAYLLARVTIRNEFQFRTMVKYLLVAAIFILPWALAEAVVGRVFLNEILGKVPGVFSFEHAGGPRRMGLDRAQGTFEHPILYGMFSSSLIALGVLVHGKKRTGFLVMIGGILSMSTAALMQVVLQLFALSWNAVLRQMLNRWKILLGIVVSTYVIIDLLSTRAPLRLFVSYATLNPQTGYHRIHTWDYGSQNVLDNPLFGIGLNDWERPYWLYSSSVDNFWLLVAMWAGFPGIIALLCGVGFAIARVLRAKIEPDNSTARCRTAWMVTLSTMIVVLGTVHIWNATYSFLFFLIGSGMWMGGDLRRSVETEPEDTPKDGRRGAAAPVYTRFARSAPPLGRPPQEGAGSE